MEISVKREGTVLRVCPEEEIHFDNYKEVEQIIVSQIEEGAKEVEMDLRNVATLYSMTLGMFNNIAMSVTRKGGTFSLTNVSSDVRKVLKATRLDKIITVK